MTTAQKIIKYCALAFAILLAVSIIGGIITAVSGLPLLFGGTVSGIETDGADTGELNSYVIDGAVSSVDIELSAAQLRIKTGEGILVESNIGRLTAENDGGKLTVKDHSSLFSPSSPGGRVTLTLPRELELEEVEIESGAGEVHIENLRARSLSLDLGAGKTVLEDVSVSERTDIDGGAGKLSVLGGELAGLEFDMGAGEAELSCRLSGRCRIDQGIGSLGLTLTGSRKDYRISLEQGVGKISLEGEAVSDGVYGSGANEIEIDGGIGSIRVGFLE